ncbi:type IV pilus assembly protein FimV [Noviherbaspirillum pedocola]|uniref:FimV N-terminal domain-containing protein n=1 Tax=Noviherbaspirillum pedocola TaxID=2801341 RepID=A0A934W764_9BURK|nr:hypothetical protein [Noviherbaspirillum pedocola]MBK4736000.1 hypothetical protein [Noviherbaspirillum pedocola]
MTKPTQVFPPLPMRAALLSALAAWSASALAIGLGPISVQSSLSQPLEASVPVISATPADIATGCLKARAEDLEGIPMAQIAAYAAQDGNAAAIVLSSERAINEPGFRLEVRVGCHEVTSRTYDVLLDPAGTAGAASAATRRRLRRYAPDTTSVLPVPNLTDMQRPHPLAAKPAPEPRSVLKVAAPETIEEKLKGADLVKPDWNLRVDTILSLSDKSRGAEQMPMWRRMQARLAAVLRNEDPYEDLSKQLDDARRAAVDGKKQAAQLRAQALSDKSALQSQIDAMYSPAWIAGLGGVSIVLAAALSALAYRRRRSLKPPKAAQPWHHTTEPYFSAAAPAAAEVASAAAAVPDFSSAAQDAPTPAYAARSDADLDRQAIDYAASLNAEMAQSAADVARVLLEAEHAMLDQNPAQAISDLERYCRATQMSPAPALYLLELYRAENQESAYANLREHIKAMFHVDTPDWSTDWMQDTRTIASFPEIEQSIHALAANPELLPFLQGLLLVVDNRFDFFVYRDIVQRIMLAIAPPAQHASPHTAEAAPAEEPALHMVATQIAATAVEDTPASPVTSEVEHAPEKSAPPPTDTPPEHSNATIIPFTHDAGARSASSVSNVDGAATRGELLSLAELGLPEEAQTPKPAAPSAASAEPTAPATLDFPLDLPDLEFPSRSAASSTPSR